MKYIFSILFVLIFSSTSFGQKIHFNDSTNRWTCFMVNDVSWPYFVNKYICSYLGEVTYSGLKYRPLHCRLGNVPVREDTILHKVYAIDNVYSSGDTERVLYDFSLQLGDTFKYRSIYHIVTSIDSVVINSTWHKIWYLKASNYYMHADYLVIEGIGGLGDPMFPLNPVEGEFGNPLTCFSTHDSTPPLSKMVGYYFDNDSSCRLTFGMGVPNVMGRTPTSNVAPNPINESSNILLPNVIQSGILQVYNTLGQLVVQEKYSHFDSIPIGDKIFVPGLYYYIVRDEIGGGEFRGKFVK